MKPHGGELISRIGELPEPQKIIEITHRTLADIECIATGIYSPLKGFMDKAEYDSVVEKMRLTSNLPWSIPIVLPTNEIILPGESVGLSHEGEVLAVIEVEQVWEPEKRIEALKVYGTEDREHPGVKELFESGKYYVGGTITAKERKSESFQQYQNTPAQTRAFFAEKGWKTVVAFQTRNPIHRAHEHLQKIALELVDGLMIHPLVGATQEDDVPAEVRMHTYETIIEKYYPKERVLLSVFPAAMRYAGPREAILHALCRKNYGCTHFIVGRDHAGVGSYYGTYDAQNIFDHFTPQEIGIIPLKFEHAFYCNICEQMTSAKSCPHGKEHHVHLSGTKVRSMLREGILPPKEFTRPEVATILMEAYK